MSKKFAVVLSGCGVYDGAEIHETVATLLAIDQLGGSYQCFAPNIEQYHVMNHYTGQPSGETRNVLVESARIARGDIKMIVEFEPSEYDILVFPGGFGVAKNLCNFAINGPACDVDPDTANAIQKAFDAKMPIGAFCIAPALIAKVLGKGTLTVGKDEATASGLENMGANHKASEGSDIVVDIENKIVSTPCYMLDSSIKVIAQGAANAISALIDLVD